MKISFKLIALVAVVLAASILLVMALGSDDSGILKSIFLQSENSILFIIIAISVPVLLIALLLVLALVKPSSEPVTIKVGEITAENSTAAESTEECGERFCMLSDIERRKETFRRAKYDESVTLESLCENLRNFAASRLRLYYDISDIRRFVAGMAVSHIIILQGMSGTGKTSLAHAFGAFIDNRSTIIPVQPMWKERTDLVGYYNEFTKKFNETLLLEKMYEANYSEDVYITVLDELNIARVEYYFAEFLSLLELPNPDERYIDVVTDMWENDPPQLVGGRIKLPPNMWYIGTANNDDSTFAISDKVYDRAMILNLDSKSERFVAPKTDRIPLSAKHFEKLVKEATEEYEISARNKKRLALLDEYLIKHFHITFGNRIMKQINIYIPVYISCGGEELEALDDILSKKVLRKLETYNPMQLRKESDGLVAYLNELFGQDNMTLCKEYIKRLERNA
jgi:MoxR-like ATPase